MSRKTANGSCLASSSFLMIYISSRAANSVEWFFSESVLTIVKKIVTLKKDEQLIENKFFYHFGK